MIFKLIFIHDIKILNSSWNLASTFNRTALIYAASENNKEIVELLLKQEGIDININDI